MRPLDPAPSRVHSFLWRGPAAVLLAVGVLAAAAPAPARKFAAGGHAKPATAVTAPLTVTANTVVAEAGVPPSDSASGLATADSVAFANPHVAPLTAALLPRPLDAAEAEQAKHVFVQRARGRLTAAEQEAAALPEALLAGHMLADLYLAREAAARAAKPNVKGGAKDGNVGPKPEALRAWLARYADHPDAAAIYNLLLARTGGAEIRAPGSTGVNSATGPVDLPPQVLALGSASEYLPPPDPAEPPHTGMVQAGMLQAGPVTGGKPVQRVSVQLPPIQPRPKLEQEAERRAQTGDGAGAMALIGQANGLEPVYAGRLRAQVVQRLFLRGDDDAARDLALAMLPDGGTASGPEPVTNAVLNNGTMPPPADKALTNAPRATVVLSHPGIIGASVTGTALISPAIMGPGQTVAVSLQLSSSHQVIPGSQTHTAIQAPPPIPAPAALGMDSVTASGTAPGLPRPNRDLAVIGDQAPVMLDGPMMDGAGLAGLSGGLAAWRGGRMTAAAMLFEAAWQTPATPRDIKVAGAFWAARAFMQLGDGPSYLAWMRLAARYPTSFYGMVARRTLGMDDGFLAPVRPWLQAPPRTRAARNPPVEPVSNLAQLTLGEADVAAIDAMPGGHRAFALLQIGQAARAEAELRCLWEAVGNNADLRRSLLLVTRRAAVETRGLAPLAAQMAAELPKTGMPVDQERFAVPPLTPGHGYAIPPALVYGVIHLESDFDPYSISFTGARGLMQLMPATATEVASDPSLAGDGILKLYDPALNLDLGQRFLVQLGRMPALQGDLMRVLASYYSGPAAVGRWSDALVAKSGGDPLLFLESIPADDVRGYVRRGLTFTWIYAARFRLPAPGLDDVAAGRFPRFIPLAAPEIFLPPHLRP